MDRNLSSLCLKIFIKGILKPYVEFIYILWDFSGDKLKNKNWAGERVSFHALSWICVIPAPLSLLWQAWVPLSVRGFGNPTRCIRSVGPLPSQDQPHHDLLTIYKEHWQTMNIYDYRCNPIVCANYSVFLVIFWMASSWHK